jgi:hypothetical protein
MATGRTIAWVERLVWILIYGGLLTVVIGLATRGQDATAGWSLIAVGAVAAVVGVFLIWVRSRLDKSD